MTDYCCPMRAKFLIGIVAINPGLPDPVEMADFVDWEEKMPDGRLIVKSKFCNFCGEPVKGPMRAL